MKKNEKAVNGTKRSKLSIVFYVFAALAALYFLYSVVSTWSYLSSYYASAGMSVTDDLSTALGYVITGSFSFLLSTVMLFGIAVIYDEVHKLNASKCTKAAAKEEKVCEACEKAEEAAPVDAPTAEEVLNETAEVAETEVEVEAEAEAEDADSEEKTEEAEEK